MWVECNQWKKRKEERDCEGDSVSVECKQGRLGIKKGKEYRSAAQRGKSGKDG